MLDNLTLTDLQIIWFILVGVLFSGYAILDGFDLGTGALQLFIKGDENRRLTLNAVGPVWDGNEVWLITGGGALFAAFPYVYASVFSGFTWPSCSCCSPSSSAPSPSNSGASSP